MTEESVAEPVAKVKKEKDYILITTGVKIRAYVEARAKKEDMTMSQIVRSLIRKGLRYEELMRMKEREMVGLPKVETGSLLAEGDIVDMPELDITLPHAS